MRRILVLDAGQRSALAIIRSLGRQGLHVVAADYIQSSLGSASRYASSSVSLADPASDPSRFVDDVSRIVRTLDIGLVMPATDATTMLLVAQRERILPALVVAPTAESYETLSDKGNLVSLASAQGIPVPETRMARNAEEIKLAAREFGFPLVLKPSRSRYLKGNGIFSTAVQILHREEQLLPAIRGLAWLSSIPCLVQRFIPGHGAGVFALCGEQGPIAWFAHERIREKPPSGGVSVLSQSAPVDPAMQASAHRLLSAAQWFGVAMIEYRIALDGTPYLMEVNGRFWGSLQLAVDSGVDFPWLLYQLVNGDRPQPVSSYVVGRRLRWLMGDIDNLLLQLRTPALHRATKRRAITQFLATFFDRSCHQEVFRWTDPAPAFREWLNWIKALAR